MSKKSSANIKIENARTNNLKGISLEIPHHKFVVVTGISGSGKSSLAFDIIAKEGQRRYFETLPTFARQYVGKISPPNVDSISGLAPVITVSQKTTGMNARSTVGTVSDIYSLLRLLYARTGERTKSSDAIRLTRSLFSFNTNEGKCLQCNGLGKEEEIDLNKLITAPEKTIREGALAPTLPTGYIMYSQVTIDVLNQVCMAEGFDVDIPWNELTKNQKKIILFGCEKIKVPFGKHSLESRLKWTGIKAKPREEGFYKGMIPIMSDILRRDRNPNILKYVSAVTCKKCHGNRLNERALSVQLFDCSIADLLAMHIDELYSWLSSKKWDAKVEPVIDELHEKLTLLSHIGLGYIRLDQPAKGLRSSEIQRIRVVNQIGTRLSNVLYVFDEPSIGLSASENQTMIGLLRKLVDHGNSVIVVEHDLETIRSADWIIDIGPKAGQYGGQLLFNGTLSDFLNQKNLDSPTSTALLDPVVKKNALNKQINQGKIELKGCYEGRLTGQNVEFELGGFNVVSGQSGTGKTDLVKNTLRPLVLNHLNGENTPVKIDTHKNTDAFDRLVYANQAPIGRTPRSNPATYTGLADQIRDLFAKLPEAKAKKFTKSRFSFNTKGGRCETCKGAGKTQLGMHFLGKVDLICSDCGGKRFNPETLEIKLKGKSIAEIYDLTVDEALVFFENESKITAGLTILAKIGLGYLTLGQSSTTLSGGEAQRVKLANELQKKSTGNTLFILDEPSIGLHVQDLKKLIEIFDALTATGNTIVCIDQDELLKKWSNTLNFDKQNETSGFEKQGKTPDSGQRGEPLPSKKRGKGLPSIEQGEALPCDEWGEALEPHDKITLKGVSTHLLQTIDVDFPKEKLTVVTGLSGSGKSSLVYDSLYAEANSRFSMSLSTYNRSLIQAENKAEIQDSIGIGPTIAIRRKRNYNSSRSTVGTLTGIQDHFRLLYSRLAQIDRLELTAQHFSFNHKLGACPQCKGNGFEKKPDPDLIVVNPEKSIFDGALNANKTARYYTNPKGQFIAVLIEIARQKKWDLTAKWQNLPLEIQETVLYGTGDQNWSTEWKFETKTRTGTQELNMKWLGFYHYIEADFERRRDNKNIQPLLDLLHDVPCKLCDGTRLKSELLTVKHRNKSIADLCEMSISDCYRFFEKSDDSNSESHKVSAITDLIVPPVQRLMKTIIDLGLGYLSLNRSAKTLSGGEFQRVQLSGQLSANLFGVTYVLDEPTIGLDQQQIEVLIVLLKALIQKGNTIIVIEHDPTFIKAAEHLIELGPGAGTRGGEVVFQGSIQELKKHPETLTSELIFNDKMYTTKAPKSTGHLFGVKRANLHNLKGFDAHFRSNQITAITGVSGSGKSTLLKGVLFASVQKKRPIGCQSVFGMEKFDAVHLIDQSPIALNGLTCPASYLGILNRLQTLFAQSPVAKEKDLKKGDFSYQSKGGKCLSCNGYGEIKTSLDFMRDVWTPCETCRGMRYNDTILQCQIEDSKQNASYNIGEILNMQISDLYLRFDDASLHNLIETAAEIGIGHLKLGQAGNTLSGGEGQRLKLAKALLDQKGNNLYLFDEPGTGLHQQDLLRLITIFEKLTDSGHTVIFIEHNALLISAAHNELKLGPGSGTNGGQLVLV